MSAKKCNVIVQTAFLGDLLLSIPLIKKTKSLWPDQELILVCRDKIGEFFQQTGLVDQVIEVKKGNKQSYNAAILQLQKKQIHQLISPHQSMRTALFCWSLSAENKISYRNIWNQFFFDHRVLRDRNLPDAVRQLSLLDSYDSKLAQDIEDYAHSQVAYQRGAQGLLSTVPQWASMQIKENLSQFESQWPSLLEKFGLEKLKNRKWVLLFPGSVWATKRWSAEGFIELGQQLVNAGFHIIVMGGPGEETLCREVHSQIPGSTFLAGQTSILESILVMLHASLVVGNDSASMHLASCVGVPMVTLFGPTVIEFGYRPWSDQVYLVEQKELKCRPCGPHGHQECPIGTHICMKNLKSQQVFNVAKTILRIDPSR